MANTPPGRYIISIDAVAAKSLSKPVIIHDSQNLNEQCNTDDIKHKSRFNDLQWALDRGYQRCLHCMVEPA